MTEEFKMPQPSYNEAMAQIAAIEAQTKQMGANDSEPSDFNQIRIQLENGDVTPLEAVQRAQAILESKMDYH